MSRSRNSRRGVRKDNFPNDPSHFRKDFNRRWKAACKAEIRKDADDQTFQPQRRQHGWFW